MIRVGAVKVASGMRDDGVGCRALSITPPAERGTYSRYIQAALMDELRIAGCSTTAARCKSSLRWWRWTFPRRVSEVVGHDELHCRSRYVIEHHSRVGCGSVQRLVPRGVCLPECGAGVPGLIQRLLTKLFAATAFQNAIHPESIGAIRRDSPWPADAHRRRARAQRRRRISIDPCEPCAGRHASRKWPRRSLAAAAGVVRLAYSRRVTAERRALTRCVACLLLAYACGGTTASVIERLIGWINRALAVAHAVASARRNTTARGTSYNASPPATWGREGIARSMSSATTTALPVRSAPRGA